MGMGRSFHNWEVREQFLWGWGGSFTTGERGSSSYGDAEVVPPLGSEGAVIMGMGRSFHHWGVMLEKPRSRDERKLVAWLAGWAKQPVAAERSGQAGV